MGWWESADNAGDTIGDGPADIMMGVFAEIVADAADAGDRPLLTLEPFLDLLLVAMRRAAPRIFDPAAPLPRRLVAVQAGGRRATSAPQPEAPADSVDRLASALVQIADEYEQMGLGRRPRPSEILGTVRFVLGYRLPAYERITEPHPIDMLRGEYE